MQREGLSAVAGTNCCVQQQPKPLFIPLLLCMFALIFLLLIDNQRLLGESLNNFQHNDTAV